MAEENKTKTVEETFAALDERAEKLESGDVSLEESFSIYQEGMRLLKDVSEAIDGIERGIVRAFPQTTRIFIEPENLHATHAGAERAKELIYGGQ